MMEGELVFEKLGGNSLTRHSHPLPQPLLLVDIKETCRVPAVEDD